MKLAHIADKVVADLYKQPISDAITHSAVIRDMSDFATDCQLSTSLLDRLCDMVERRLRNMPA